RFLPKRRLEDLVGWSHGVQHAGGRSVAIPLPHPSGASSWIHTGNHPALLERALSLLAEELLASGVVDDRPHGERQCGISGPRNSPPTKSRSVA
ncbi:MAG TPA: hypothetical protein VHV78_13800, partial [Gemmatimonadaceae bacterium]|nr:hypothetical protein [Gemmatimonadaceae bacterium]